MTNETCEQCLRTEGTPHEFRYGRAASARDAEVPTYRASAYPAAPLTPWTDRYQVGGVEAVVLCSRCLARARVRRAGRVVLHEWVREPLAAVGYVAWVAALAVLVWQGDWTWFLVGAGAGLAVTAVVFGLTYAALRGEDFAQHLAVDLHQEKLREQGWDAFWTETEFALRAPH